MNYGYETKDYIENLPDNTPVLYAAYRNIGYIPDLSRFRCLTIMDCSLNNLTHLPDYLPLTLKKLYCFGNQLYKLPTLPNTLEELFCQKNRLISLPSLPDNLSVLICCENMLQLLPSLPCHLTRLDCEKNRLITIPPLPSYLRLLFCYDNCLRKLPNLPETLSMIFCGNNRLEFIPILPVKLREILCEENPLIYKENTISCINQTNKILGRFQELYYHLKCKKQFREILWERIRQKHIKEDFHPSKIRQLLDNGIDIEDLEFHLEK